MRTIKMSADCLLGFCGFMIQLVRKRWGIWSTWLHSTARRDSMILLWKKRAWKCSIILHCKALHESVRIYDGNHSLQTFKDHCAKAGDTVMMIWFWLSSTVTLFRCSPRYKIIDQLEFCATWKYWLVKRKSWLIRWAVSFRKERSRRKPHRLESLCKTLSMRLLAGFCCWCFV